MISRFSTIFSAAAFGILGMVLVVFPSILHGKIPGDLADGRFNEYLLEHFYQWITGRIASFWDAGFFYPFPLTIGFSDNFLGNGVVFAALRMIGLSVGDAFRGWYAFGFLLNFAACAFVLRRLGYRGFAAAAGAFLFAFGLPVTAQEAHVQLFYRFGVPLAALGLIEFGARARPASQLMTLFWTVWQFYCSIYIGYFLSLLLIALALSIAVQRRGFTPSAITFWPGQLRHAWQTTAPVGRSIWAAGMLVLTGLLIVLFIPYFQVSALYGFRRSPGEIGSMLPRLASYLFSADSKFWRIPWSGFDGIPMLHEHAMFVGLAPFLAIGMTIVLRIRTRLSGDPNFASAAAAIILLAVLTLSIGGHSIYAFVEHMPGANAIRAVSRISTVLLFPFAVLMASGLDAAMRLTPAAPLPRVLAALIAAVMVTECAYIGHYVSDERAWLDRLTALDARLPPVLPDAPILMVAHDVLDNADAVEIDAMLLAQQHGWQTFNGYSAITPPGHAFTEDCQDAAIDIERGLQFLKRDSDQAYRTMAKRAVRIGYFYCDDASLAHRPSITSFSGTLPADMVAKTVTKIGEIRVLDRMLYVAVSLSNQGPANIPTISTTGAPVRVSVKYVPVIGAVFDPATRNQGWDLRQNILFDIPAGETRLIDFPIPAPPSAGTYRLAASLVQEGLFWFHDRGMQIAVSHQTVSVAMDGSVKINE